MAVLVCWRRAFPFQKQFFVVLVGREILDNICHRVLGDVKHLKH